MVESLLKTLYPELAYMSIEPEWEKPTKIMTTKEKSAKI